MCVGDKSKANRTTWRNIPVGWQFLILLLLVVIVLLSKITKEIGCFYAAVRSHQWTYNLYLCLYHSLCGLIAIVYLFYILNKLTRSFRSKLLVKMKRGSAFGTLTK